MVYVDLPMNIGGKFDGYCHLWADDVNELHQFADVIGLKREWFQDRPGFPHYDISRGKRDQALRSGATVMMAVAWMNSKRHE